MITALGALGHEAREAIVPQAGQTYELFSVPAFETGLPENLDGSHVRSVKRIVRPGDVLICKINPRINRVWLVPEPMTPVAQIASPEYLVFRVSGPASAQYLLWYFRSPRFRSWLTGHVEGVTGSHTRVKSPVVLRHQVPVPPIDEQRRIVATIEEHLSRLDAGGGSLRKAAARIAQLRNRLLNRLTLESPAGTASRVTVRFGDLVVDSRIGLDRGRQGQRKTGPGTPYIKMDAVTVTGTIAWEHVVYVDATHEERARFGLQEGDLLFNTRNSVELVGKTGLVKSPPPGSIFNNNLMRLRFDHRVNPVFLGHLMCSPWFRSQLATIKNATTSVAAIYASALMSLEIPLPTRNIQDEEVSKFERIDSTLAECANAIRRAQDHASSTRRAILSTAFTGNVVQNPLRSDAVPVPAGSSS